MLPTRTPSGKPSIMWTRFWCPLGSVVHCGHDGKGFLTDPTQPYGQHYNPKSCSLDELVPQNGPLILCGEPGMGKTRELCALLACLKTEKPDQGFISLNSREHIPDIGELRQWTVASDDWKAWRASSLPMTLSIDAIDEGLIQLPTLVSNLRALLANEPVDRLRLILTCRSAHWPESQGDALLGLWGSWSSEKRPVFELCPLRDVDAAMAAEAYGIHGNKFLSAVSDARVIGLAARPVTLFLLIDEFSRSGGLPSSRRELYERSLRCLASELDSARVECLRASSHPSIQVTLDDKLRSARRLAVLLLCGGKSAITFNDELPIDSPLLSVTSAAADPINGSRKVLDEVIRTALFTSVGTSSFGFAHQTFAESLAAQLLAELPFSQVRSLLMQHDHHGEHVVPQLSELAAWTVGYHAEFLAHVLRVAPAELLSADPDTLTDSIRSTLTEALLATADRGGIGSVYLLRDSLHRLSHPLLADQLSPYLNGAAKDESAELLAIKIAGECNVTEVADALFVIARNPDHKFQEQAANSLCTVLPSDRVAELIPLAKGEVGPDPQQQIRGFALGRLIPSFWSVADAIPHLPRRAKRGYSGQYDVILRYHLKKHLKESDLSGCFGWLRSMGSDLESYGSLSELADMCYTMALQELDSEEIATAFVDFLNGLKAEHGSAEVLTRDGVRGILTTNRTIRRKLLSLILRSNHPELDHETVVACPLVADAEDFNWLLDQLPTLQSAALPPWIEAVRSCVWQSQLVSPNLEKLVARIEDTPLLAQGLPWLRVWSLEEPEARHEKAKLLWLQRRDRRREKRRAKWKKPDRAKDRREALRLAATSPAKGWFPLWRALQWGNSEKERHEGSELEVLLSPGWALLTLDEQGVVRKSARDFLISYSGECASWHPGSEAARLAAAAVWLLREALPSDAMLREAISSSWVRVCACPQLNTDKVGQGLYALLDSLNAEAALAALEADINERQAAHGWPLRLAAAKNCWDDRHRELIRRWLQNETHTEPWKVGIETWHQLDPIAAANYARDYLQQCLSAPEGTCHARLKQALIVALQIDPAGSFNMALNRLSNDLPLASVVWSNVCHDIGWHRKNWGSELSPEQSADLYLHLSALPDRVAELDNDEDDDENEGLVPVRHDVQELSNRLISQLANRGTLNACVQIGRLMQLLPKQRGTLRWHYHNALTHSRRVAWSPPSPHELGHLLSAREARFIQSEEGLLELILESLARYQQELTGNTLPRIEELWNSRPQRRPHDEPTFSRAIARWLRDDLSKARGLVVNCEPMPQPGQHTDILVQALLPKQGGGFDTLTVTIEVKGGWHDKVQTAMHTQLVEGYLRSNGRRVGLYLVGWFACPAWKGKPSEHNRTGQATCDAFRDWLTLQVSRYDGRIEPELVRSVVLDCAWPDTAPSQAR